MFDRGEMDMAECENKCNKSKSCTAWEFNSSSRKCMTFRGSIIGEGFKSQVYKCSIKKDAEDPSRQSPKTLCKVNVPDCAQYGGYNPKDLCMQTCHSKTIISEENYCGLKCIDYNFTNKEEMEIKHSKCLV